MLPEADRLEPKMRTPKSQRQSGGHREGKLMIGLRRVWGWEEGRDVGGGLPLSMSCLPDLLSWVPNSRRGLRDRVLT